jgi:hypothetical protein
MIVWKIDMKYPKSELTTTIIPTQTPMIIARTSVVKIPAENGAGIRLIIFRWIGRNTTAIERARIKRKI